MVLLSAARHASVAALVLAFALPSVTPAMAQGAGGGDCTCVISSGASGMISRASANVFLAAGGSTGQQQVAAGTALQTGSIVTTGPLASADIDFGETCRFAMAGSMRMQVSARTNDMCVQVFDESPPPPVDGAGAAVVGASVLGGGVLLSLGMLKGVSD